jgi:RimJ/RimL family protein N-acetyltransferase
VLILEHVILRPLETTDIDRLYEYRNDTEISRYLGGFSSGYSRADLAEWLERHRHRTDEVLWCIASRPDDRCIGHAGLYRIDARVRKAELGLIIGDRSMQGRGIGKAVSVAAIDYAFRELNLHKVFLEMVASNERSVRLYEKLGFRREGILRDDQFRDGRYVDNILMSILEDEWRSAK